MKPLILQRSPQVVFHAIEAFRVFLKLSRLKHNYKISSENTLSWNSDVLTSYFDANNFIEIGF